MSLLTNQAFHLAAMQSEDLAKLAKVTGYTFLEMKFYSTSIYLTQQEVDFIFICKIA